MSDTVDTHDLISTIERKDRRFRFFQTLFMVGTFIALIIIIGGQQRTLDGVQKQLSEARQTAQKQSKQTDESQATVLRRLDCLAVYFSQTDRASLTIENIDQCTLNRNGTPQQFFQNNTNGDGGTSVTPMEQTPGSTAPNGTANGSVSGTTNPPVTTPTAPATPATPAPQQPISIVTPLLPNPVCLLGLLCVQ
jgi:hypothetical protein